MAKVVPSRSGSARKKLPGRLRSNRPSNGRFNEATGNRRPREMAVHDKTRLIGPLQSFFF